MHAQPAIFQTPLVPHIRHEWLKVDQLACKPLTVAVAYWNGLRGDRRFPARDALQARAMVPLMPYMSLVKVIDGGADFEHRIVGDLTVQAFAFPVQNRRFSDIAKDAPEFIAHSLIFFRKCVQTRAPAAWRTVVVRENLDLTMVDSEVVLLPLGTTDDCVDHILGFAAPSPEPRRP